MFETVDDDDNERRLDGYTLSSPCEPLSSGELYQRTTGPVNAHLISDQIISTKASYK